MDKVITIRTTKANSCQCQFIKATQEHKATDDGKPQSHATADTILFVAVIAGGSLSTPQSSAPLSSQHVFPPPNIPIPVRCLLASSARPPSAPAIPPTLTEIPFALARPAFLTCNYLRKVFIDPIRLVWRKPRCESVRRDVFTSPSFTRCPSCQAAKLDRYLLTGAPGWIRARQLEASV